MEYEYNGGQPMVSFPEDDGNAYQQEAFYNEVLPETKTGNKKAKGKNDKATKDKKPAVPIVPSFEGYVYTVLDAVKPGETASWVRTRKTQMPLSSQELYDKAVAHERKTGHSLSRQFQELGTNQQTIVNRLVAEKNAAEKEPNAAWTLFGVRKNWKEHKATFKVWRVNDAIRVTLRRGDKTMDVPEPPGGKFPHGEIDKANIVDLREPAVKKEKEPAPKDKKKKKAAATPVADYQDYPQYGDPFQQNDYVHNVDPYPPYEDTRPQQQAQWPQQPQQPQHDPFSNMHEMSGALPIPEGAIPAPPLHHPHQQQHEFRPEAPMPPQQPHYPQEHPFQPDPRIFPQPQQHFEPFDERQPRDPVAHGHQHISARRPSLPRRRESVDSEKIRAKDARKIADVVRDEVRDAMREAVAEDKVLHQWQTNVSGSPTSSRRSGGQDDFWSNAGSSGGGDRRYSYSTPGTSPDRGERYYQDRPTGHFRRRDSSGGRPYVDERKRYYTDRDRIIKPHDSYRDNGRDVRYLRDRRQSYDDYPTAHQQRLPSRERQYDRPRLQRRVTDYQEALHDADFGRQGRGVDYERMRMNDREDRRRYVHEERRDGRHRQSMGYNR